jgi:hypothetical protein
MGMSKDPRIEKLLKDANEAIRQNRSADTRATTLLLSREMARAHRRRRKASDARSPLTRWWFNFLTGRSEKRIAQYRDDVNAGGGI